MDQLPRALVIVAMILGGAFIVRGLYPADRFVMTSAAGGAYRLDRLTGAVAFCDALVCRALPLATLKAVPAPATPSRPTTVPSGT